MLKTLILIPSRLSATRLPGKPLLKINGLSIISQVVKKAQESKIGETYVATEDEEIVEDVEKNGGKAILTSKKHSTGSDRIFECFQKINLKDIDYIINLQGDEPNIDINDLKHLERLVKKNKPEIGTLASKIKDLSILKNENIVKVITNKKLDKNNFPIALKFQRKVDQLENWNVFHHVGVYAYKTEILEKIVHLKQSKNEIKNNLEQLRATENNIKINVALAKSPSIGVDTMEDYLALKKILEYKS
jgi:3-deoxy-manno-octulosonate cytidylyltransferase (CMP-KDO synthetase)